VMARSALEVAGVLARPAPLAEIARFDASAIAYRLTYWIDDFPRSLDIESAVRGHLWYALQRAGLQIPFPILHAYTEPLAHAEALADGQRRGRVTALLGRVDFLSALKSEEIDVLARHAPIVLHPAGGVIVRKGEPGDSLLVVASGRADLMGDPIDGHAMSVATREVGDYFGEMSLLTGAPRPFDVRAAEDTELVVLTREVMRPILVADPSVAERLSKALDRHLAGIREALPVLATAHHAAAGPDPQATLLGNIRRVFGLDAVPAPGSLSPGDRP